jgi:hypothetical protein
MVAAGFDLALSVAPTLLHRALRHLSRALFTVGRIDGVEASEALGATQQ